MKSTELSTVIARHVGPVLIQVAPELRREYPVPHAGLTLGRHRENDVVLDDNQASRRHCRIAAADGGWVIEDCGSRNGTFLGAMLIRGAHPLRDGDRIWIGGQQFEFSQHRIDGNGSTADDRSSGETFTSETDRSHPPEDVETELESVFGQQHDTVHERRPAPDAVGRLAVERLLGDSPSMRELRQHLLKVAPTDATVLLKGESGSGKELAAQALHVHSRRKSGPFICLNCAALSETLLESELFGHEKGAFTGADAQRAGKFEQAHRGTLFLDEIGEMSLPLQAKMLRILEGHRFERVGGSRPVLADVRILAATNRELDREVRRGRFRKDLYFRLHVVPITLPPLRMRREDVPLLAEHFVAMFAARHRREVRGLTATAIDRLQSHDWPGNVRELQNTIERGVIYASRSRLDVVDIQLTSRDRLSESDMPALADQSLEAVELAHIRATLEGVNGNRTKAAEILGIERSTLVRKLKRQGVNGSRLSRRSAAAGALESSRACELEEFPVTRE